MEPRTVRDLLRYLVVKALAGRRSAVQALYDYFVRGESVSTISRRYGITRNQVRGYILRAMDSCLKPHVARAVLRYAAPAVAGIEPIAVHMGSVAVCTLCGEPMPSEPGSAERHIATRHRDVVERHIESVLHSLRRAVGYEVRMR